MLGFAVYYQFLHYPWVVFIIVLYEGLLGGAAYVNTFHFIHEEVCELHSNHLIRSACISQWSLKHSLTLCFWTDRWAWERVCHGCSKRGGQSGNRSLYSRLLPRSPVFLLFMSQWKCVYVKYKDIEKSSQHLDKKKQYIPLNFGLICYYLNEYLLCN